MRNIMTCKKSKTSYMQKASGDESFATLSSWLQCRKIYGLHTATSRQTRGAKPQEQTEEPFETWSGSRTEN